MHPSEKVTLKDSALGERRLVLGITGSIAAVESVKLIRELLRHGAEVIPVMSEEAQRLISPEAVEFAAGRPPITRITGQVEHVKYCGDQESAVDLLLIAPSTANTISKIACGIDDTPVTTFATTALGTGVPVMIAPSMHGTMYRHKIVLENIERLKKSGVEFVPPVIEEGKAKMAPPEIMVEHVIRRLAIEEKNPLAGKKVLIIGGSTAQPLDEMRIITNRSSGKTAVAFAVEAFRRGAEVEVWYGQSPERVPPYIENVKRFGTVGELLGLVEGSEMSRDIIILCAAISDYTPEKQEGKIPSGQRELMLRLVPIPKVIENVRKKAGNAILVGYKAESGISTEELISRAEKRMKETGADFMAANLLEDVGERVTTVHIMDRKGAVKEVTGTREETVRALLDFISERLRG